jgi:hypothetical protein
MRHNIDRCRSTESESAGCRRWRSGTVPTPSLGQDVPWRMRKGTMYKEHDKRHDTCCNDLRITSLRGTLMYSALDYSIYTRI